MEFSSPLLSGQFLMSSDVAPSCDRRTCNLVWSSLADSEITGADGTGDVDRDVDPDLSVDMIDDWKRAVR